MIQFMGGGAKQWNIKYRLYRHYDWTKMPGYSNIETFPCMGGEGYAPLAPKKLIMEGGLASLALYKLRPCY